MNRVTCLAKILIIKQALIPLMSADNLEDLKTNDNYLNLKPSKESKNYNTVKALEFKPMKAFVEEEEYPVRFNIREVLNKFPEVKNQRELGACSAFSVCNTIQIRMAKQDWKGIHDFEPSVLYQYYNARRLSDNEEFDSGATIADAMLALYIYGFVDEKYWPYDSNRKGKDPKFKQSPPSFLYDLSKRMGYSIRFHEIELQSDRILVLNEIKKSLTEYKPIILGMKVFESMRKGEAKKTGVVPLIKEGERCLGAHAVVIKGYDDEKRFLKFRNSWGTEWGDKGNGYLSYDHISSSDPNNLSPIIELWSLDRIVKANALTTMTLRKKGLETSKSKRRISDTPPRSRHAPRIEKGDRGISFKSLHLPKEEGIGEESMHPSARNEEIKL